MRRSASSAVAASNAAMTRTLRLARQSGCLNLSSRDFHAFPDEVFRLYELLDEDERRWECAVLRKLDLRYRLTAIVWMQLLGIVGCTKTSLLSTATMRFQSCQAKWKRSSIL